MFAVEKMLKGKKREGENVTENDGTAMYKCQIQSRPIPMTKEEFEAHCVRGTVIFVFSFK